ncbi:g3049 [Coccomyxa viridis]|uniref:G3049 protein n=1 Tax=Coccomyxa viridis TaxID=1274662 RepID=A0ABP1FTW7_9CHLO
MDMFQAEAAAWRGEVDTVTRCGHLAGAYQRGRLAINSGVNIYRNRPQVRALLERWRSDMLNATKARHITPDKHGNWTVTDQLALTLIFTESNDLITEGVTGSKTLIWMANHSVRVLPLPVLAAMNGHTAFVQELHLRHNVTPFVAHATFNRFEMTGKTFRFREKSWWLVDPDEYYADPAARYLAYSNSVVDYVAELEEARGPMVPLHKHLLAVAFQLAALRDAWAIAWALNRTLVLPRFWSWCEMDQVATVLETCRKDGGDQVLPFQTPADYLLSFWALPSSPFKYKEYSFLDNPRVPAHFRTHAQRVHVVASESAPQTFAAGRRMILRDQVDTHVLTWTGLLPGTFGGFLDAQATSYFNEHFSDFTRGMQWCCSAGDWNTDHQFDAARWVYIQPRLLMLLLVQRRAGMQVPWTQDGLANAWRTPTLRRPAICEMLQGINKEFARDYENHPCNFLKKGW